MELLIQRKGDVLGIKYDDQDHELISRYKWHIQLNKTGVYYARGSQIGNMSNRIYMHRLVMNPANREVLIDHVNGNGLDNRRINLRECTRRQNAYNSRPKSGNEYKGIEKSGDRWVPRLTWDGVRINLGRYDTPEEAALIYNKLATKLFGDFAKLNTVTIKENSGVA